MSISIVIPAYQPDAALPAIAEALAAATAVSEVVVIDDGSDAAHRSIFDRIRELPRVVVLEHAANLGKGAALKTGFRHALSAHEVDPGIVTADADGQHDVADVLRVAAALEDDPTALIVGARTFSAAVPLRSRIGNAITRAMVRLVVGQAMMDTQSGLRGLPRALATHMIAVRADHYEFELEMLVSALRLGLPIRELPIRTIYLDGNRSSHFHPALDSMRVASVLLRIGLVSLATAVSDIALARGSRPRRH